MTLALYVIVSTVMVLVLSARLRDAQEELTRARQETGDRARAAREEQAVCAQAVALSLACLLAGMAAWYAPPPQPSARPAGPGREDRSGPGQGPQ